jgi:hypothetical protein
MLQKFPLQMAYKLLWKWKKIIHPRFVDQVKTAFGL